jgi:molecular chaperone DnaJ
MLRVRGEGEAVKGGPAGDLYVNIHVESDPRFEREGSSIISTKRIGFTQAALGDTIEVETVDGPVDLKIPAGTQTGTQFRLRGKGVPMRGGRGDQIVIVEVATPEKLSREQKKMLEDLDLKE